MVVVTPLTSSSDNVLFKFEHNFKVFVKSFKVFQNFGKIFKNF